jgi:hypothetical protein
MVGVDDGVISVRGTAFDATRKAAWAARVVSTGSSSISI